MRVYKFGMLLVFVILVLFQVWMLAGESTRDVAKVGLIVVVMFWQSLRPT